MTLVSALENVLRDSPSPATHGWNFSPRRYTLPYKACLLGGTALVSVALAAGVMSGVLCLASLGIAAVAATGYWYGRRHVLESESQEIDAQSFPAAEETRQMVGALFERAGMASVPVSTLITGGDYADNAAACGDEIEAEILVGTKVATRPETEQCAVIAHEVGHIKGHPHAFYDEVLMPLTKSVGWGLVAGTLGALVINGSPQEAMNNMFVISLAAKFGSYVMGNIGHRFEEDRADRNAFALYPHPTALKDFLRRSAQIPGNEVPPVIEWVFSDHTPDSKRLRLLDKFRAEASAFFHEIKYRSPPPDMAAAGAKPAPAPLI